MARGTISIRQLIKRLIIRTGIPPSAKLEYINELLHFGRWLGESGAWPEFAQRDELYEYVSREVLAGQSITYLEFGVFEGKSLRKWTELNTESVSAFWGFDSFEGLPGEWSSIRHLAPKGEFDVQGNVPNIADPRVNFVEGLFQETLPPYSGDVSSGKQARHPPGRGPLLVYLVRPGHPTSAASSRRHPDIR